MCAQLHDVPRVRREQGDRLGQEVDGHGLPSTSVRPRQDEHAVGQQESEKAVVVGRVDEVVDVCADPVGGEDDRFPFGDVPGGGAGAARGVEPPPKRTVSLNSARVPILSPPDSL